MEVIEKVKELITPEDSIEETIKIKKPKHIAITTDGKMLWAKKNNVSFEEACKNSTLIIKSMIKLQAKLNIPIMTFYLLPTDIKNIEHVGQIIDVLVDFFTGLPDFNFIHKNRMKISVLGKWYDLPGRVVEPIKKAIEETKDYDNFFINFCVNYDGQEEIVDACKVIAMQIKAEKMDAQSITKGVIKENIYASYFLPPDIIIKNGASKKIGGLLLWDSIYSTIYFTNKLFPDFTKRDLMKAIRFYNE